VAWRSPACGFCWRLCRRTCRASMKSQVSLPVLLFAAGLSITAALVLASCRRCVRCVWIHNPRCRPIHRGLSIRGTAAARAAFWLQARLPAPSFCSSSRPWCCAVFRACCGQDRGFDSSHVTLAQVDLFAPEFGDKMPNSKAVKLALPTAR
jgi:hypothetical protein